MKTAQASLDALIEMTPGLGPLVTMLDATLDGSPEYKLVKLRYTLLVILLAYVKSGAPSAKALLPDALARLDEAKQKFCDSLSEDISGLKMDSGVICA